MSQSSGTVSRNHSPSRNSCPWNSIGMPGEVSMIAAARHERFWACQPVGSCGLMSYGTRARPFATSSWLSE